MQPPVRGLLNDKVLAIQWETSKTVTVQAMWAGSPKYLVSLSTPVPPDHWPKLCRKTLHLSPNDTVPANCRRGRLKDKLHVYVVGECTQGGIVDTGESYLVPCSVQHVELVWGVWQQTHPLLHVEHLSQHQSC